MGFAFEEDSELSLELYTELHPDGPHQGFLKGGGGIGVPPLRPTLVL